MIQPFIKPKEKRSSISTIPLHYLKIPNQSLGGSFNSIKEKETLEYFSSSNQFLFLCQGIPKIINTLSEIESLSENISIINSFFFSNYHERDKIENFKKKYEYYLNGTYLDTLLIMKEFPEFCVLDYINLNIEFNLQELSKQKKREQKLMMITRNNIILKLLVLATDIHFAEVEGDLSFSRIENNNIGINNNNYIENDLLFADLSFLQTTIEQFKTIIVENENILNIEYDVEVLFLALLGYKDKAKIIKQKHNDYFKNFIAECDFNDNFTFDDFLSVTIEKKSFSALTMNEILIFRKILNNAARRKFYFGFEFIMKNVEFCYILSEGRIWKNLGKKLTEEQVYILWGIYEDNLEEIKKVDLKETLGHEYKIKINSLKGERKLYQFFRDNNRGKFNENNNSSPGDKEASYNLIMGRLNHDLEKLIDEIHLFFVTSLKDLLTIFFKCELKELVMYFFDQFKKDKNNFFIPLEIYETSLEYDEAISIDIMDSALNHSNVKGSYMGICLLKRYFKLARKLLKFRKCKEYLNSPPPETDEYIGLMSKLQVNEKFKKIDEITYKHPRESIKIFEFLNQVNTITSNDETISDGTTTLNNNEEDSISTNTKYDKNQKLNSTFNRFKRIMLSEKEESLIKFPKKNIRSNIYNHQMSISNLTNNYKNKFNQNQRESISIKPKFSLYNDSSEINFLDSQIDNISNYLEKKDRKLSKIKEIENESINDKNQVPTITLQSDINRKRRSSVIPNMAIMARGSLKNNLSGKPRERRKSFFIPFNEHSTPTGKLSIVSNVPIVDDKDIISINSKLKNNISNLKNESESSDNDSENEDDDKKGNVNDIFPKASTSLKELPKSLLNIDTKISTKNKIRMKYAKKAKNLVKNFKKGKIKLNVQLVLIDELRNGEFACDALCLLSSIEETSLNLNYCQKIFSYILVFTSNEETITKCKEPLLFIALAAEFLLKIGNLNKKLLYKAQAVAQEILELGEKIQSSIQDEEMLKYYLKEQFDHKNRNPIEIYAENKFFKLLSDSNVGGMVDKLWYGSGYEYSSFKFLRITRILKTDSMYENFIFVFSKYYFPPESVFTFQFNCFKNNCSARYFFDNFTLLCFTFYYQYIVYIIPSHIEKKHETLMRHEQIVNAFLITYFINFSFAIIFCYKTGRTIKFEKLEIGSQLIIIICIILLYFKIPHKFSNYLDHELSNKKHELIEAIIVSIILIMSWIKLFCIFMETSIYGPFLRIMTSVFSQVFFFMLINICINFVFAQIFTIFFQYSHPNFNAFYNGFLFLFGTSFGQVEFDGFSHLNLFGYIFLMSYTTLSNIILFNLIVGIINNLFENATDNAEAESRAMLVLTYDRLRWDDKYGLLILLPAPLNILSFPFSVFLLLFGEKINNVENINLILCKIFYFFIAIVYFFVLIISGIIFFPFSLIKSYYHITFDFYFKNVYDEEGILTKKSLYRLFIDYLLLPFYLLLSLFEDLFNFLKLCYKEKNISNKTKEEENLYSKEYIYELRRIFCQLKFKEKKKVVSLYEIYERLHLFNKSKKLRKLLSNKNTLFDLSGNNLPDYSISNMSGEEFSPSERRNNNRKSVFWTFFNNKSLLDKKLLKEAVKNNFRTLLDKLVDTDGFIDLDRALILLPYQVKYSESFLKSLKYLNLKVIIRGMRKFLFKIEGDNSKYAYKKMQFLIYKIMLKFNMLYNYLSDETILKVKEIAKNMNSHPQFGKNGMLIQMFEKRDDESEYDDEGEGINSLDRAKKCMFNCKYSGNLSSNSNNSNSKESK